MLGVIFVKFAAPQSIEADYFTMQVSALRANHHATPKIGNKMITLSILNFAIVCGLLGAGVICALVLLMLAIGGHINM